MFSPTSTYSKQMFPDHEREQTNTQLQDIKKVFETDHKLMMTRLDRVINSDPFEVSLLRPDTPKHFLLLEYESLFFKIPCA